MICFVLEKGEKNMKKIRFAPSALSADFGNAASQFKLLEKKGIEYLHLDVMDGIFVPNISFGQVVIKALRPHTDMIFDTHLMITKPERYIDDFVAAGSDYITIHYEATENPAEVLDMIRAKGVKSGVSVKPGTPAEVLIPLIDHADLFLVMTVEPGFGGQRFMADMMPKLELLRDAIDRSGKDIILSVDGGIDPATAPVAVKAGADLLVAGSAVFKGDIEANIDALSAAVSQ